MHEIKTFLNKYSKFPGLYHENLECQILVSQGNGTKKGNVFTDGIETWFSCRISKPGFQIPYDLPTHVEAIGLSGWNFKTKTSEWVGFDFDSITNHRSGLSNKELNDLIEKARDVPWIEIRRSTSGKGLHFYIFLDIVEKVASRKEHALLAKALLKNLSGILNFNFIQKVDKFGGILWLWHKKGHFKESFELIKPATDKLKTIPKDWKEENKEFKNKIQPLVANLKFVSLNEDQHNLIKWFSNKQCTWWWDSQLNMLVCHTFNLLQAYQELKMRGIFFTNSTGKDCPHDQNCFLFPIKNGAWIVRRHTIGTKEHPYWQTDTSGWTYCYLNKIPSLSEIAKVFDGQENEKKEHIFFSLEKVIELLKIIAPNTDCGFPEWANKRKIILKSLKDSKISIKFERVLDDPIAAGWIPNKNTFEKVIGILEEEPEIITPDGLIRHVIANEEDAGWYVFAKNNWVSEPKSNIYSALVTLGFNKQNAEQLIGQCILNPWELVNIPFEVEYPGNRQWNKFAPQLNFDPKEGDYSTWKELFNHIGKNLNEAVLNNSWCLSYEISTGGDYLKCWTASVFQYPQEPLPYLFLFGPQLCGKSTFHEALSLLTSGVIRADIALTNKERFNGELAGAVICVVEETNLQESKVAYNRIKDWTTGKTISIHKKKMTPFDLQNTTHWIQCANNPSFCPVLFGDTRIILIEIAPLERILPKEQFLQKLKEQAPAFVYEILNYQIPPTTERLRIPILETEVKRREQIANANLVEQFILEKCKLIKGYAIKYSEFCLAFKMWCQDNNFDSYAWSNIKIGRAIPLSPEMPIKGRLGSSGDYYLGNISFDLNAESKNAEFIKDGERLVERKNNERI